MVYAKTNTILRRLYRRKQHNILYIYGPPNFDNLPVVRYARHYGFKVFFDLVEDDDLAAERLGNLWHRLSNSIIRRSVSKIQTLADGIVVISSHLEKKIAYLSDCSVPIHKMPITVDMSIYPETVRRFGNPVTFFYAGSFGQKDGVPVLIDAFERIAVRHESVRLVMTGRGSDESMRAIGERISASGHKDCIVYRGYLNDADYYKALSHADILCMPRIDMDYAQAGFPFKLGEYLATGKPVIASAVSDIPDLLKGRHAAMLVPPGSSQAIAEAAEALLNDQACAFEIGARARATARDLFDYREQSRRLYHFIRHVVETQ